MIINMELRLNFCENPWQGSFIVDKLTDIVEEAEYKEFEALSGRGGVLGAMDTMYQRGKIQEESLYYKHKEHDGSLPLVGVSTFLGKGGHSEVATTIELIRCTPEDQGQQIDDVARFVQGSLEVRDPRYSSSASTGLAKLQATARDRKNIFAALMDAVKTSQPRPN